MSIENVLEQLLAISTSTDITDGDIGLLTDHGIQLLKSGWNEAEVFNYLRHMEEVSPHLREEFALRRMAEITAIAKARLEATSCQC